MTYLLLRMRAQDRIEGREPLDWDENDYTVVALIPRSCRARPVRVTEDKGPGCVPFHTAWANCGGLYASRRNDFQVARAGRHATLNDPSQPEHKQHCLISHVAKLGGQRDPSLGHPAQPGHDRDVLLAAGFEPPGERPAAAMVG
jgi:hypothetical protein